MENSIERFSELAEDVIRLSRNTLLVNLRFLDMSLSMFKHLQNPMFYLATDGEYLVYNPVRILKQYRLSRESIVRDYLHVVLHCVYRHMFIGIESNCDLWNLACDITVENIINELELACTATKRQDNQTKYIAKLKKKLNILTAEKIYSYLKSNQPLGTDYENLVILFQADDHSVWYMSSREKRLVAGMGSLDNNDTKSNKGKCDISSGERDESNSIDCNKSNNGDVNGNNGGENNSASSFNLNYTKHIEAQWKNISERMQEDLETFSKLQGDRAGSLTQNLASVNREKYDYTSFLKKFATMCEVMKINDDEFDYNFYTYGMKLYGNVPLIEPLEYKEEKRIREFVIAIDTSGSTSGDLVQKFVQKTYNILKSTESFATRINLHIIQCDAEISEHIKITTQEEFDKYIAKMRIHGLGGTDFRPVFARVDQLVAEREFSNLRGLIYFTDGYGTFPSKKPDYKSAFVFVDDEIDTPQVPAWAIKLVLPKDEI